MGWKTLSLDGRVRDTDPTVSAPVLAAHFNEMFQKCLILG